MKKQGKYSGGQDSRGIPRTCQQAMVLENASLVCGPESSSNIVAFLCSEDDTAVVGIDT